MSLYRVNGHELYNGTALDTKLKDEDYHEEK